MARPDMVTWPRLGRQLRSWGEKLLMLSVVLAVGITWIDLREARPGRALEADAIPDSGYIIRIEVIGVWLPDTLIDLARQPAGPCSAQSHQDLRTVLERSGQQNLWFALTTRHHQINGGAENLTYIRYPYLEPDHFRELLNVLAIAAGKPPLDPSRFESGCAVHIVPEELSDREPRAVVEQLLSGLLDTRQAFQGSNEIGG